MEELKNEVVIFGKSQQLKGVIYVVIGDVIEFGCKEIGDCQFFGILGWGKFQVVYVKVNLNIVNVNILEVVFFL